MSSLLPPLLELEYNAALASYFGFHGGLNMKQTLAGTSLLGMVLVASQAMANAPAGGGAPDYSGISYMYYSLIGVILAYGVYDTFFKKS